MSVVLPKRGKRDMTGAGCCWAGRSRSAARAGTPNLAPVAEGFPALHELAAELADSARGQTVPAGHVEGALAQHQVLDHPAVAFGEGVEPAGEVAAEHHL